MAACLVAVAACLVAEAAYKGLCKTVAIDVFHQVAWWLVRHMWRGISRELGARFGMEQAGTWMQRGQLQEEGW